MITLAAAETIAGVAGTATAVTYTIHGMELLAGVETYKTLAQGQLAVSAGTLYTVAASTQTFVKEIHLANATGTAVTGVSIFSKGTTATNQLTGSFTIPANGWAVYASDAWKVYDTNGQLQVLTGGSGGGSAVIGSGQLGNGAAASTTFSNLGGAFASSTEANVQTPVPATGTISNLFVTLASAQPGTGTQVLTFRKAGVDQTLTVTITAGAAQNAVFSDTTHSISVTVADLLGWKFVNNASTAGASFIISFKFVAS